MQRSRLGHRVTFEKHAGHHRLSSGPRARGIRGLSFWSPSVIAVGIGQKLKRFARKIPGASYCYQKLQRSPSSGRLLRRRESWLVTRAGPGVYRRDSPTGIYASSSTLIRLGPSILASGPPVSVIIPVFNRASDPSMSRGALVRAAVGLESSSTMHRPTKPRTLSNAYNRNSVCA